MQKIKRASTIIRATTLANSRTATTAITMTTTIEINIVVTQTKNIIKILTKNDKNMGNHLNFLRISIKISSRQISLIFMQDIDLNEYVY